MEVIRIPQAKLVDSLGRGIGLYSDDPDWWQQLKLRQSQLPALTENGEAVSGSSHSSLRSTFDSTTNLIKNSKESNKNPTLDAHALNAINSDHHQECNKIGETPLHIAILYDDLNIIKYLIEEKNFDVNLRCVEEKFVNGFNNRLTSGLIQQSKYEGLAYYGEYPLAFAACFASKEIYDYLIEKGADPNLQDTNGNTVLHVLVINNLLDMFQYATNHPMKKALLTVKNNQDLTPINLAAKLGRKAIFDKMLELQTIEFWRYSNITCSAYPLEGLDTVDADGKIAPNAALSYVVNGSTDDHLDMLEIGVVKRLLEDKWSTYAQRRLYQKLAISAIHLLFLSIAVYTRAPDKYNLLRYPMEANTYIRYIAEIIVVCGCLATIFQAAHEIYAQGMIHYLKNLTGEPANVFYMIFALLILAAVPFRFITLSGSVSSRNVEDSLFIIAIPCGWVHLLFYARVATVTGPFVVMIYKMIAGDILIFGSVYIFLLIGFSLGFYYLYKNAPNDITSYENYPEALMRSFHLTLGERPEDEFNGLYYSEFIKVIFVAFIFLIHIMLLNMLIAMMGNTYQQIIGRSEKEWRKQWAQVVILLERSFSPQDLKKFQNQYCIKLPSKGDSNKVELGLMVIKKVAKTKVFQQTTCKRNWKRFYKSVLSLLKTNRYSATKLLEVWDHKDKHGNNPDDNGTWNAFNLKNLKTIADDKSKPNNKTVDNKNNKAVANTNKKPPVVDQIKVKSTAQEAKSDKKPDTKESKADNKKPDVKNEANKNQAPLPPTNSTAATGAVAATAAKQAVTKSESEPKTSQATKQQQQPQVSAEKPAPVSQKQGSATSSSTSGSSRPMSDIDDTKAFAAFSRTNTNKLAFSKAFKPNQMFKLYTGNEGIGENYDLVNPREVVISPQRDLARPDLKDIRRPPTSTNRFSYNNMSDTSSLDSENLKSPRP